MSSKKMIASNKYNIDQIVRLHVETLKRYVEEDILKIISFDRTRLSYGS